MASSSIGRYEVLRQLGTGRHGRTFEARRDDGRHVALREIECEGLAAADRLNSDPALQQLCAIIAGLSHESLANTLEVFALGQRVYVAEEFLGSPALSEVLRQSGPLPLEEARAIACQVLAGVEFGHQRGLLHLDLRTPNIHYDREHQRAVLTDFGHMQLLLELRPRQSLAAIADAYHAPEVRAGRSPTPASELYSVAVILHELLTGCLPRARHSGATSGRFDFLEVGDGAGRSADKMLDELAERWPGVISVLRKALSEKPGDRYQRAAQMLNALAHAHRADVRREPYREGEHEVAPAPEAVRRRRQPEAPALKVEGGISFCAACGRPMAPGSDVCLSCGARSGEATPEPEQPPAERSYFQKHADRLMEKGRYADAEKALRMAAKRNPGDPLVQRELGDVLAINRRFADAEAAYREALRLRPEDLRARHELGRVLLSQNKGAEAITELQKLLDSGPPRAMRLSALTQLGAAYASMGQRSLARKTWQEVLEAEPGNARVHFALATSFLAEGDPRRAREHLRQAVAADPNYIEARRVLEETERQVQRGPLAAPPLSAQGALSPESALITEALWQLGGMLGREQWGGRASRSTWRWTREDGWEHFEESFETSGGRRVPIEEAKPPAEDDK